MPLSCDDDLNTLVVSLKLGSAVLVATLIDVGLIGQAMRRVYAEAQRPLHPAQAAEFKARAYYAAYLLAVVPDVYPRRPTPADDPDAELVLDALVDDVTSAVFNPWDNLAYAHTLAGLWPAGASPKGTSCTTRFSPEPALRSRWRAQPAAAARRSWRRYSAKTSFW
ncbi:MAG: hypothetical protein WKG07_18525 [Hymenobacter sp.]